MWPRAVEDSGRFHSCGGSSVAARIARVCEFEADGRTVDCAALYFVAVKRAREAGISPVAMLAKYSSFDRTHTARAERIRRSPPMPKLERLAEELLRGARADPCPNAVHWGGRGIDPPHGRMIPARCSRTTANHFYALARKD